jgi:hypothetical protein
MYSTYIDTSRLISFEPLLISYINYTLYSYVQYCRSIEPPLLLVNSY